MKTVTSHLRSTTADTLQTGIGKSCIKLPKILKRVDFNVKRPWGLGFFVIKIIIIQPCGHGSEALFISQNVAFYNTPANK